MRKDSDRRGARRWICWRLVVERIRYATRQFGRDGSLVDLKLECGHTETRKGSVEPASRVRCTACQLERFGEGR